MNRPLSLVCIIGVVALTGCVDRRFVVATNVPGAQVSIDGRTLGPAPVDATYDYAGWYEFRANAPGYEPLVQRHRFQHKWYDYPGLDFFAEVLWPLRIEDVRYVNLELVPAQPIKPEELLSQADAMRARAASLPPPSVPDDKPENARARPDTTPRPPVPQILPGTR